MSQVIPIPILGPDIHAALQEYPFQSMPVLAHMKSIVAIFRDRSNIVLYVT